MIGVGLVGDELPAEMFAHPDREVAVVNVNNPSDNRNLGVILPVTSATADNRTRSAGCVISI